MTDLAVVPNPAPAPPLKLDFGCGKNKAGPDWTGVDERKFDGVDVVLDLRAKEAGSFLPWPWPDGSVDEARASHFVEHLEPEERIHFVNELYRILKPGASVQIVTPHWASMRAYGDLTHKWPPVSEFWYYYLSKDWRKDNAPHNDFYTCDFEVLAVYSMHPSLMARNDDYRNFAMQNFKESAQDVIANMKARKS